MTTTRATLTVHYHDVNGNPGRTVEFPRRNYDEAKDSLDRRYRNNPDVHYATIRTYPDGDLLAVSTGPIPRPAVKRPPPRPL